MGSHASNLAYDKYTLKRPKKSAGSMCQGKKRRRGPRTRLTIHPLKKKISNLPQGSFQRSPLFFVSFLPKSELLRSGFSA